MLKPVSFLVIALFGVISVFPGNAAQMTPQIQELLRQKEEKAKQLEACDGKRKAWMIAGISTIGLTAVGVGVNIAQANKSKKLDTSINSANTILKNQETELNRINAKISEKERERAEAERKRLEQQQQSGVTVGEPCNDVTDGIWTIDAEGTESCFDGSETYKCKCVARAGEENDNEQDDDNGVETHDTGGRKIGETCNEGKGKWKVQNDGNQYCADSDNKPVKCECVANSVEPPDTGGRKIGNACIEEDINKLKPYGWVKGRYIKVVNNNNTVLKASCTDASGAVVKCNCAAEQCLTGYKVDEYKLCAYDAGTAVAEEYGYYDIDGDKNPDGCNVSKPGDWCVKFQNYTIKGIAACSDVTGKYNLGDIASDQNKVNSDYTNIATSDPKGVNCYCKITNPKASKWVFSWAYSAPSSCADQCPSICGTRVHDNDYGFRGAVFGAVTP